MSGTNDSIRSRARLYLRAERAFGAMSVPAPAAPAEAADSSTTAQADAAGASAAESADLLSASPVQGSTSDIAFPMAQRAITQSPALSHDQKAAALAEMDQKEVRGCPKCPLCKTRTHTVFGEGDVDARIMFIGEGPGEDEDRTGRPFVGRAGQLLNKMIAGMGLAREQVYIANIVKCRPPGNRVPEPDEAAACKPYLLRQIDIIRPKVIVTLGLTAAKYLLDTRLRMGELRGNWQTWNGIRVMPTFHPSYVLRVYTEATRKAVWSDLKQVLQEVGLPAPARGSGGA